MSAPPLSIRALAEEPEPNGSSTIGASSTSAAPGSLPAVGSRAALRIKPEADALSAFESESEIPYKTQRRPAPTGPGVLVILLAVGIVGGILGLTFLTLRSPGPPAALEAATTPTAALATPMVGQAQFDSRPSGAEVVIDGVVRGRTPIKLSLPVGDHSLEIRGEAGARSLPLSIDAGILVSQYVELGAAPDRSSGRLEISSEPPGAQVRIDGVVRGVTPLSIDSVDARSYNVALSRGSSTIYRSVRVAAGATASVFASMNAAPPTRDGLGGFVSFTTPFEMQVLEDGRVVGTTSAERVMLQTGRHRLELVSAPFQFRTAVDVEIVAGRTVAAAVAVPNGALSVNAIPWADVLVDGRAVGTTPLANLTLPIGSHEVTWRHPRLGERRQFVSVTAQSPARISVNLSP
jgi:PEGA domain